MSAISEIYHRARQRFVDWRHERSIKALSITCLAAYREGEKDESRRLFHALTKAVRNRSPKQVARMDRERGLRHA